MKPEKPIRLTIESVENGYVVQETSYENSLYMGGRRWVAESRAMLCEIVNNLSEGFERNQP